MKKIKVALVITVVLLLSGCLTNARLDDLTMVLTLGLDYDENGHLTMYSSNPVFSENASEKTEIFRSTVSSLREGRGKVAGFASGKVVGGKLQTVVVSERLARGKKIFPILDVFYRDPKNSTTANLVVFEGALSDLMGLRQKGKSNISVAMNELIATATDEKRTVETTLLNFHRMVYEKGITPYVAKMELRNRKMFVNGIALFNNQGNYIGSLSHKECPFFYLLQKKINPSIPLTIRSNDLSDKGRRTNFSISIEHGDIRYRPSYKYGRFKFDIEMELKIILTERIEPLDIEQKSRDIEKVIEKEIKFKTEQLVKKLQKQKVDPVGFGLYARAFEYEKWKEIDDDWGNAFANATVSVHPKVKIISYGVIK